MGLISQYSAQMERIRAFYDCGEAISFAIISFSSHRQDHHHDDLGEEEGEEEEVAIVWGGCLSW